MGGGDGFSHSLNDAQSVLPCATWQGNLNLEMQNNPGRLKFQSAAKHSKLPVLACRSSVQEGPTARLGVVLFAEETSVISISNFVINFSMHTSPNKMLIDVLQPYHSISCHTVTRHACEAMHPGRSTDTVQAQTTAHPRVKRASCLSLPMPI